MYKNMIREFVLCTMLPFLLPFIFNIPDSWISFPAKWIIFIIVAFVIIIGSLHLLIKRNKSSQNDFASRMTRLSYSHAYELNQKKSYALVKRTYNESHYIPEEMIPYDVHEYIKHICEEFLTVISKITSINKEYLSVSFVYRYVYTSANDDARSWKWIVGKEHTIRRSLHDIVEDNVTLFHHLVYTEDTYIFKNDKKDLADQEPPKYYMSKRDKNHNNVGAVFCTKIMFSNNADNFVESILMVSSYGKRFVEDDADYDIPTFKNLVYEEIFPYYLRLLEAELGILYLRHKK